MPAIGSVATVLTELDIVGMGRLAHDVGENHFMLAAPRRTETRIRFYPYADIEPAPEHSVSGRNLFARMVVIHEHERHRAVAALCRHGHLRVGQEAREFVDAHLAVGVLKLAMTVLPFTAVMGGV